MRIKNLFIVVSLAASAIFQPVFAGGSVGVMDIPRDYGPFKLGMSEGAFIRLTDIAPAACPVCLQKETLATLSSEKIRKFVPEHRNAQGVDFFFLNGELYLISRTPDTPMLNVVKDELSGFFGGNGKLSTQPNGVSTLKWEDATTIVTVSFNQTNNEVFSVNIEDWNLSQEKSWLESLMVEQTADVH
ncbi:MAG: hypothetical protein OEZ43_12035 [Gammaproteobacteria bacterium]|nr:hypothetical protein [Gammaproteobacteria bacterium]